MKVSRTVAYANPVTEVQGGRRDGTVLMTHPLPVSCSFSLLSYKFCDKLL